MSEKLYTGEVVKKLIRGLCPDGITLDAENYILSTIPTVQAPVVPSRLEIMKALETARVSGGHTLTVMADAIQNLLAHTTQEQKPVVPSQPVSNPYKLPEIRVYEFEIDEGEGDHYVEFVRKWEFDDILLAHGYREPVEGVNHG